MTLSISAARTLWEPAGTYLNTASFGLPPRPAWDALQRALDDWRTGRTSWEQWGDATEAARLSFARLVGFDRSLEEAAVDLGCPPLKTFLTITLPLIAPAIAAGWMLAFVLSLDDLVIASFTTGPGATTLPIRIYSEVRLGVKPEINAVCTIMIAIVALGTVASSLIVKRGVMRRERAALGAQV